MPLCPKNKQKTVYFLLPEWQCTIQIILQSIKTQTTLRKCALRRTHTPTHTNTHSLVTNETRQSNLHYFSLINYSRKYQQTNRFYDFALTLQPCCKCHVPSSFFLLVEDTWEYERLARDLSKTRTETNTNNYSSEAGIVTPKSPATTPSCVFCKTDQTRTIGKLLTNSPDLVNKPFYYQVRRFLPLARRRQPEKQHNCGDLFIPGVVCGSILRNLNY